MFKRLMLVIFISNYLTTINSNSLKVKKLDVLHEIKDPELLEEILRWILLMFKIKVGKINWLQEMLSIECAVLLHRRMVGSTKCHNNHKRHTTMIEIDHNLID